MRKNLPSSTTLVFPATNQAARDYFKVAQRRGESIVAAASVHDAEAASVFGNVVHLPYINDAKFPTRFLELVKSHNVRLVYSPVATAYAYLAAFIAERKLKLELVGASPIRQQVASYQTLRDKTARLMEFVGQCAGRRSTLSFLDVAAIYRQAGNIYGESSDDKIAAMMAIFADAPEGDVVEVGSLMGKSAFVLIYLARHYGTGTVLAIDPWSADSYAPEDAPGKIQSSLVDEWDYQILHEAFIINLLPFHGTGFNYLRLESEHAFELYRQENSISTPDFGKVACAGEIAVVHIDGNHDYRHVSRDCELWLSRLASGGWLILDDYQWAHGDGPHRVGNALLEERRDEIARAFVCGKALFVQFK